MKIVIVGGGMAGLTAYMSLKKHLPPSAAQDIKIYERHSQSGSASASANQRTPAPPSTQDPSTDSPSPSETQPDGAPVDRLVFGGGLGLAPNGMRTLEYLSPDLHARVTAAGFPAKCFELRTAANGVLGSFPAGTEKPTKQDAVMTSWLALWEELRKDVPAEGVFMSGRKVVSVEAGGAVVLDGGERVQADLVIGADGAKSICRSAVLEEGESGDPVFQGLMNFGGFVPTASLPPVPRSSSDVVMTFGAKGFFGYAPCNSSPESDASNPEPGDTTIWWSTFSSATPQSPPPNSPEARAKLQDLHGDCLNPVIRHIVQNSSTVLSTPTWTVPKLPRWSKGRIVLVGDAAHALPSTSGQGVSQAFEDVVTLRILLGAVCGSSESEQRLEKETIAEVAERYTKLRKPRVEEILDAAMKMQGGKREMKWWEIWMMYAFMWVFIRLLSTRMAAKANEHSAKDVAEGELRAWKGAGKI